jgi:hypothetical protein
MNKKGIIIVIIILFILLLGVISIATYILLVGKSPFSDPTEQKYWHFCNVVIKEKFFGTDKYIDSIECARMDKCGLFPFNIFTSEGKVEMWEGEKRLAVKDYELSIFHGKTEVTLRACTAGNSFQFRLYDNDGNLEDTGGWSG